MANTKQFEEPVSITVLTERALRDELDFYAADRARSRTWLINHILNEWMLTVEDKEVSKISADIGADIAKKRPSL
ncbi:unnamed protein product [marine sediment metagenome]|uniref:Ribbon-helix-helix protein CopG domain-containing protein n=1 Tax=marine sediment metagenome TaxID=412755 RepID=X1CLG8_9ZZZZ